MTEIWQQLPSWINKNSQREKIDPWAIIQQTQSNYFIFQIMSASFHFRLFLALFNLCQQQVYQTKPTVNLLNAAIYQSDNV